MMQIVINDDLSAFTEFKATLQGHRLDDPEYRIKFQYGRYYIERRVEVQVKSGRWPFRKKATVVSYEDYFDLHQGFDTFTKALKYIKELKPIYYPVYEKN